jgi:hypothetical protein
LAHEEKARLTALRNFRVSLLPFITCGCVYPRKEQGKLAETEHMYERALDGDDVQQYFPALCILKNTGDLYATQAGTAKARTMYAPALLGLSGVLGQLSDRCTSVAAKLDVLQTS